MKETSTIRGKHSTRGNHGHQGLSAHLEAYTPRKGGLGFGRACVG